MQPWPSRALPFLTIAFAAAGWVGGCNGLVDDSTLSTDVDAGRGAAGDGGGALDAGVDGAAGGGGKPSPDGGVSPQDGGAKSDASDAASEFVDPGCPDAAGPKYLYECDLYAALSPCGPGEGCVPFVQYPDTPCGQEVYGAVCAAVGTGKQGDGCEDGCAAGHICVISGAGTQCVKTCDPLLPKPCADGLVCSSVDIPGVGGCL